MEERDSEQQENLEREGEKQDLKFTINNLKSEMGYLSRLFSPQKLEQFDEICQRTKDQQDEIEAL